MSDFILLCGIPGSGKTTMGKAAEEFGDFYKLVSSDDIRETLWGDASDQRNPKEVFRIMKEKTILELLAGHNVIYDATNIKRKDREAILSEVKLWVYGVQTYCFIFDVPVETCIAHNHMRERQVPDEVIYRMAAHMQRPEYNEGWDYICNIKPLERENK